jgi:uncharacterized protein (TIGR02145 family)
MGNVRLESTIPRINFYQAGTWSGLAGFSGTTLYLQNRRNGTLKFRTNNYDRITIDEIGDVGIGTTSIYAKLHILQTESDDAFRVDDASGDTSHFTIKHDGDVGIGTATPAYRLDVSFEPTGNTINPLVRFQSVGIKNASASIRVQNTSGNHFNFGMTDTIGTDKNAFSIGYNANIGLTNDLLTLVPEGNLGIGNRDPVEKLDVDGRIKVGDESSATSVEEGTIRYNTTTNDFEGFNGQWVSLTNNNGISGLETVTDIDGNIYGSVVIYDQVWMRENLRVSRFNDGTPIPEFNQQKDWGTTSNYPTIPAWCWYENDAKNDLVYGKLYNWYTVDSMSNGNKNVCPVGWHVPSQAEWNMLIDSLGVTYAGPGIKEAGSEHWQDPNEGTNYSGFTALPGGNRTYAGWDFKNSAGYWWTRTETTPPSDDAILFLTFSHWLIIDVLTADK